jgi:hypothetical protein
MDEMMNLLVLGKIDRIIYIPVPIFAYSPSDKMGGGFKVCISDTAPSSIITGIRYDKKS